MAWKPNKYKLLGRENRYHYRYRDRYRDRYHYRDRIAELLTRVGGGN